MKNNKAESHNLHLFFLIAFAFSWLFWIPKALIAQGLLLAPSILVSFLFSPFNPAAFGPLIAAISLTYLNEGKSGLIKLLKRGVDYKFKKIWLIPIFLLMPLVFGVALLLSMRAGFTTLDLSVLSNPLMIAIGFIYIFFLAGPLQEEFGWRGYALDRLQARYNALVSSVILGFMWGMWHLPLFTVYYQVPIWAVMVEIILVAILFTWIYNNTNGSILAALLFHTMLNLSHFMMFPTLKMDFGSLYYLILALTIVVIVVLIIWGPKRMVREERIKTTSLNSG